MYRKKPVFLTDGKGGIYKIEKLIKAAILKNLETGESITAEIIGSTVMGFAIIDMPKVDDVPGKLPEASSGMASSGKPHKVYKPRKNKSSQYYGVSLGKGKKPWRGCLWLDGKNVSTGGFITEVEAARSVDAELERKGQPKRNFP